MTDDERDRRQFDLEYSNNGRVELCSRIVDLEELVRDLWAHESDQMMFCAFDCPHRHECLRKRASHDCDHTCEWRESVAARIKAIGLGDE